MDEWLRISRWISGHTDLGREGGMMDGWMGGRMDGQVNGWIDLWMNRRVIGR